MNNSYNTTKQLLKLLKIKYTTKYLKNSISSHQDHNSLLAIKDTLSEYNIENIAIKVKSEQLDELPLPCIVQVDHSGEALFYILKNINNTEIQYYNEKSKLVSDSKEYFLNIWTGICLFAEKNESSKEIDIEKKLVDERMQKILLSTLIIFFIIWSFDSFYKSEAIVNISSSIYVLIYTLLKITGTILGVFLLWFEIDQHNPSIKKYCVGGKKINCSAVLTSKKASLFKGNLSLSIIGFSYFLGSLLLLIISKFSIHTLSLLALMSFSTFPTILISGYYQAVVIKQWCKFCILTQAVLVVEIFIAYFGSFYSNNFTINQVVSLMILLLTPIIIWKFLKPLLEEIKELNTYKQGLNKIKSNPNVFENLLLQSRKISTNPKDLGIFLRREHTKYNLVKVCSPYCGPCAKAHPILEKLVNENIINLQILFTPSESESVDNTAVSHLLAIDNHNSFKIQEALDDWYLADKKDYDAFAKKYPLNGELAEQNEKMNAMRKWCKIENITHTPTIFINGYELPQEYDVEDLKNVLI